MAPVVDGVVSAVNGTSAFLKVALEPVPMNAVMLVFTGCCLWVWFHNLRVYLKTSRVRGFQKQIDRFREREGGGKKD